MIEDRLTDQFRAAVIDEPPLGFDPDDVVDRAARRGRHRTATVFTVTAVAVVAVGAVAALQLARPGDAPTNNVATMPTTSTSQTSAAVPTCDPATGTCGPQLCDPASGLVCNDNGLFGYEVNPKLQEIMSQVVADHLVTPQREIGTWRTYANMRCLAGAYGLTGSGTADVVVTICHDQQSGLDRRTVADLNQGTPKKETRQGDGSLLRVYEFQRPDGHQGLAVSHHRLDGVIVQAEIDVSTATQITEAVLTPLAVDGRLTF